MGPGGLINGIWDLGGIQILMLPSYDGLMLTGFAGVMPSKKKG